MIRLQTDRVPRQEIINKATEVLNAGGLVVYPTETTYGIGADATNADAIEKLLDYKAKRAGKALSVMVADEAMAQDYVELNDTARGVYARFLPGPVTVVSVGRHKVAPEVESAEGTLGIRLSSEKLVRDIAVSLGRPFTATGANASGERRPYKIQDVLEPLSLRQKQLIDLVIDAGELPPHEPSTVIDTTLDTYRVLRQGTVAFDEKHEFLSHSEDDTRQFGQELARRYRNEYGHRAVIFALEGELGAGKTQFSKGLAAGLGITEIVRSPSYTLVHEYTFTAEGRQLPFVHIDAWRLEQADELEKLGLEEYLNQRAVVSLEWANSEVGALRRYQPGARIIWVRFAYGAGPDDRRISWNDNVELV